MNSYIRKPWVATFNGGPKSEYEYVPFLRIHAANDPQDVVVDVRLCNIKAYRLDEDANDDKLARAQLILTAPDLLAFVELVAKLPQHGPLTGTTQTEIIAHARELVRKANQTLEVSEL